MQATSKHAEKAAKTEVPASSDSTDFHVGLEEGKPTMSHRLPYIILSVMSAIFLLVVIVYWIVMY